MIILLSVNVFAGGSKETTAGKPEEAIKIGATYPLTGGVAPIGLNIKRGIDFAVKEINDAGGVLGRKIQIVYGDTTGDAKVGMAEAERLITRENVSIILGSYQSAVTNVVSEVAQRYETPNLTAISTADVITTRGYDYFFRLAPTNMLFLRDMIQYCADVSKKYNLNYKTVGIITGNDLLGQESRKWAKYWSEKLGFQVISEVQYTINAVDLSSEVLTVKRANPDILVIDPYISDAILITRTLHEQGFTPKIVIGKATGLIDPSYIPTVGALANGITTATEWNVDIVKAKDVNDRFFKEYGINMNGHTAEVYTAVYIIKEAIEKAKSTDRKAIKKSLEELEINGKFSNGQVIILPYDKISFDNYENEAGKNTNQNSHVKLSVVQIQNGKYITVWPFEAASAQPIIPLKW
jgi:branched-chain amino acid transport system substrate-binding protein